MDDYYELLDVAADADRDDIRGAYRSKRDELQAKEGADNRARIAELNRAWNVLSDPTQRQRYDERLADWRDSGSEDDDGEYDEDDDDEDRPVPVTRAQRREETRRARSSKLPTIVLPDGLTTAQTRSRLMAMGVDLLVLLLIFTAVQVFGIRQVDNRHPGEQHRASVLIKTENKYSDRISADKKKVTAAQKKKDAAAEATAKAQQTKDQAEHDKIDKVVKKIDSDLAPGLKLVFLVGVIFAFLYLVPSTALTGQTLGKRYQKIRVVKLDGSVPGWATAAVRFGVPLLVAVFLGVFVNFGLLGLGVAVIGMVGWVSQPNRQGLHDRLAKTVVVDA